MFKKVAFLILVVALTVANTVALARYMPDTAIAVEAAEAEAVESTGVVSADGTPTETAEDEDAMADVPMTGLTSAAEATDNPMTPVTTDEESNPPMTDAVPVALSDDNGVPNEPVEESADPMKQRIAYLKEDHETAGYVYEYLYRQGWSDVSIAAVLGNMMAECGGQTLTLQGRIYDETWNYYGLCQWSLYYNPSVNGVSIPEQMDYLIASLRKQMSYFGGTPEEFFAITDVATAARYFCNKYEIAEGVEQRAKNAVVALEWIQQDFSQNSQDD